MLEVCENEIALCKLFGGTAQLRTSERTLFTKHRHMTHFIKLIVCLTDSYYIWYVFYSRLRKLKVKK